MEANKNQNNKLFIIGIICFVICISSVLYSLYILPFLIWTLSYNVSDFVLDMIAYFEDDLYYTPNVSRLITWLILFVPGIIAGVISYLISYKIDKQKLGLEVEGEESEVPNLQRVEQIKREAKESAGFGLKILFLMGCALGGFIILQMII